MSAPVIYLKNSLLRRLLIWRGFGGRNWMAVIFIDATLPEDLQSALVGHENYHSMQMQEHGYVSYAIRYMFSRDFRMMIEEEAYFCGPDWWYRKMGREGLENYIEELYG